MRGFAIELILLGRVSIKIELESSVIRAVAVTLIFWNAAVVLLLMAWLMSRKEDRS